VSDRSGFNPSLFFLMAEESITGVMVFRSTGGRCIYMNRIAREALEAGIGEGDASQGMMLKDLFPTDGRLNLTPFSEDMVSLEGYYQNVLMRKKNGMVIIANIAIKHVQEDGSQLHLMMFEDITLQKKLQREIEVKQDEIKSAFNEILEQNQQLKELDLAKNRFIALTTHELRTPLSAIVATAEVLNLKLFESDEQRDDFIKTIYEQGLHLMELVNDILDFAKIQAGKMELYVERIDAIPLVTKLAQGFDHMASQAQVAIEVKAPPISTPVYVDALRLKEVVNNVVSNAIKYNKPQGRVTLEFSVVEEEKLLRISVTDTGQGIPANKLHHVFNEFETVGNVARHHKGTGLGMPISKRLMKAMGGDLSLESVEGEGTTFFIDIPIERVLSEEHYRARSETGLEDLAA